MGVKFCRGVFSMKMVIKWSKKSALLLFTGIFLSGCTDVCAQKLEPSYSNLNYSCRCLPVLVSNPYKTISLCKAINIHKNSCEFKSYIRDLDRYVEFLKALLQNDRQTLSSDLINASNFIQGPVGILTGGDLSNFVGFINKTNARLLHQKVMLKKELEAIFKIFPYQQLSNLAKTNSMKEALLEIGQKSSFQKLFDCWEELNHFDVGSNRELDNLAFDYFFAADAPKPLEIDPVKRAQQRIETAHLVLKDFADITVIISKYLMQTSFIKLSSNYLSQQATVTNKALVVDLIDLYNKINDSPISQTIVEFGILIDQSFSFLVELQNNSNVSLWQWLKENWKKIPLVVAILLVKLIQALSEKHNNVLAGYVLTNEAEGLTVTNTVAQLPQDTAITSSGV
jgi:hypothetical protein